MEVLPACRLPGHERNWGGTARKTETDSGLWAPHEHHCWRHHRSAFHQKQSNCRLSLSTDFYSIAFAFCPFFLPILISLLLILLNVNAFENVLPVEVLGLLIKSVKGILKNNIFMFGEKRSNSQGQKKVSFYYFLCTCFLFNPVTPAFHIVKKSLVMRQFMSYFFLISLPVLHFPLCY